MKDYDIVVKERYDKEQIGGDKTLSNVYSMFNNTGFCGALNEYSLLHKIVRYITKETGRLPSELKLLDVGCGKGVIIRMLAELVESPQNVYGTELSINRIAHCKKMNDNIDVRYADITESLPFEFSFDCVFSFDVIMHLKMKEQVVVALNNICANIREGGYFLWYEPNVHSHFDDADNDSDGAGFSVKEMLSFAEKSGFKPVNIMHFYKQAKIGRFYISTYYMNRISPAAITLLSFLLLPPLFKPLINCILFKKEFS